VVDIVEEVTVSSVRYKSENGCVFRAFVMDHEGNKTDKCINVALTGKLAGENFRLYKGQCFKISAKNYTEYINKKTGEIEDQLQPVNIVEMQPTGKNFISYIAFNDVYPNIGLKTATAIYKAYGTEIYNILDKRNIDDLLQIDGVTDLKAYTLIEGWHEDKKGKVIEWLDMYGLPNWLGIKLVKAYSNNTFHKIDLDPYRLVAFMVSFAKVDSLAMNHFGITSDDPRRLHGAVAEALFDSYMVEGNTAMHSKQLLVAVEKLLGNGLARQALNQVYTNGGFVKVHDDLFQSRGAFMQESYIAKAILDRCSGQQEAIDPNVEKALKQWQKDNYELTDEQHRAVLFSFAQPLSVITGGAGVGKTSVLEAFNYVIRETGGRVLQMALSGRAAKRMHEATGEEAITIAGFLYKLTEKKLMEASHIVIDESSMVDLHLLVRVFKVIRPLQNIVFVGDSAQLPPVGAGKVFHQLSEADFVPVTRLTKVWRQDESTGIPKVSQNFREGFWEGLPSYSGRKAGVSIVSANKRTVGSMVQQVFSELGGNSDKSDVKIICPTTNAASWGALGINRRLSEIYAGKNREVFIGVGNVTPRPTGLHIGDTVMATKNNWEKGIMNGSLGTILRIATEDEVRKALEFVQPVPVILVSFDTGEILLDEDDLSTLQWGYAITCHKAQGSQFRRVIIPIVVNTMLDRTWIYTALTRGVEQVVFVGDTNLIKAAIKSNPIALDRTVALSEHFDRQRMIA